MTFDRVERLDITMERASVSEWRRWYESADHAICLEVTG
jgi:hypothetical protein